GCSLQLQLLADSTVRRAHGQPIHGTPRGLLSRTGDGRETGHRPMPAVRPATICRVATRNSTTSGSVAMTRPANSVDQEVWYSPKKVVRPTGKVYRSRSRTRIS